MSKYEEPIIPNELIAPNDWLVKVKNIRSMHSSYLDGADFLFIFVTDNSGKDFTFRLSSPTLQAAAWAAFSALRSNLSVQVTIRVHDESNEVYAISVA
ncbi:hypothetical protein [Pseudomonas mosselii]|uniref:Uncharacterized protein n=1 Tax=Pseudomonas mosselii TaxID=78327 RepID=A0AA42S142_9PSED|nr:hypothetical protein [Pseudomonas mosselii]MDH1632346.1 hypothetical protein [Pseudomonas mosselii]